MIWEPRAWCAAAGDGFGVRMARIVRGKPVSHERRGVRFRCRSDGRGQGEGVERSADGTPQENDDYGRWLPYRWKGRVGWLGPRTTSLARSSV